MSLKPLGAGHRSRKCDSSWAKKYRAVALSVLRAFNLSSKHLNNQVLQLLSMSALALSVSEVTLSVMMLFTSVSLYNLRVWLWKGYGAGLKAWGSRIPLGFRGTF